MDVSCKTPKHDLIETIQDMLGLHDKDIDEDLLCMDYEGNMVCLHCGHCGLIKALKAHYTHCITDLHRIFDNESDWRAITSTEFDQFRISPLFASSSSVSPAV